MKKQKRVLYVTFLLSLTLFLLAGCGSSEQVTGEEVSNSNETNESATEGNVQENETSASEAGDWDDIVEAAKEEGKLVLMTHPGQLEQQWVNEFQKAYPEIEVEHSGMRPSDFSPRVISEQENDKYLWDVMVAATSSQVDVLTPADAFQDIRPFFPDNENIDDDKWYGDGFELYAQNVTGDTYTLIHAFDLYQGIYVNRDILSEEGFSSIEDLLKPELKGQIVIDDPSVPAHGSLTLTGILNATDEEFLQKLLVDQEPVFVDDVVIATNWAAEGRYPIVIGGDLARVKELQAAGVGTSLENFKFDGQTVLGRGASVFKNAPHPNATKVFLNWLWSQEGQAAFSPALEMNSRRNDVPPFDPELYPEWDNLDQYSLQGTQKGSDLMTTVRELYQSIQ